MPEVENTAHPIFEKVFPVRYRIPASYKAKPLKITVFQHRDFPLIDKELGSVDISLAACYGKPCEWTVNGSFPLHNESFTDCGEVYIAAQWVPEGSVENKTPAEMLDKKFYQMIPGKLHVMFRWGRNLLARDRNLIGEDTSDPLCRIVLPGNAIIESDYISRQRSPQWNQLRQAQFKCFERVRISPYAFVVECLLLL
jgi:hypothetical protein